MLDEWVEHNADTWAPSSARDQRSRVKAIKADDKLARMPIARLSVADVEQWHARLRRAGKQDAGIKNLHGALRAALAQAQRWGWVNSNVAAHWCWPSGSTEWSGESQAVRFTVVGESPTVVRVGDVVEVARGEATPTSSWLQQPSDCPEGSWAFVTSVRERSR